MGKQIEYSEIQNGTQIVFDGNGFLFGILSRALWCFSPVWRKIKRKPWHLGFAVRYDVAIKMIMQFPELFPHYKFGLSFGDWWVCEAAMDDSGIPRITLNPLDKYDLNKLRFYRWHDSEPTDQCVEEYLLNHLGAKYDAQVYVWTIIAELFNAIFRVNIGRWNNESYNCWENTEEFNESCDKPLCKKHSTIMITDFCLALGIE